MNEVKIVNGMSFCAKCYAEASKDAKGSEELGSLIYEMLHYELKTCR